MRCSDPPFPSTLPLTTLTDRSSLPLPLKQGIAPRSANGLPARTSPSRASALTPPQALLAGLANFPLRIVRGLRLNSTKSAHWNWGPPADPRGVESRLTSLHKVLKCSTSRRRALYEQQGEGPRVVAFRYASIGTVAKPLVLY